MTTTRKTIAVYIARKNGIPLSRSKMIVTDFIEAISGSLASGVGVEIRNFGVWRLRIRRPSPGRRPSNPSEEYQPPPHVAVVWRPSENVRSRVRKLTGVWTQKKPDPRRDPAVFV
jgi:nucleoid DNA-binding protein